MAAWKVELDEVIHGKVEALLFSVKDLISVGLMCWCVWWDGLNIGSYPKGLEKPRPSPTYIPLLRIQLLLLVLDTYKGLIEYRLNNHVLDSSFSFFVRPGFS